MISTIASLIVSGTLDTSGVSDPIHDVFNVINSTAIDSANRTLHQHDNDTIIPVFPTYIRNTSIVFCAIIMCLGVIGNVMVPIVIFKSKDMRNSTNIFLVNLSVADLMVLLVCTPTVLVEVNSKPETWVLGQEMCKAVPFVEMTVAHASVLTILAISFERYYAICKPLKAGYVCTKARASLICLLAWFFAAVFTSPILTIAEYHQVDYFDGSSVPACHTLANSFWSAMYFLMTIFLFFIIPLILLLVIYGIIAKNLISDASKIVLNKHIDNYGIRARRQVVLMLGTVVLSFFLCLIPFRVFIFWIIIVPDEMVKRLGVERYYNILYFCRIMVYLNSAINPILYNLMSSKFREGFLLCSKSRKFSFRRSRNGTLSTTVTSYRSSGTVRSQGSFEARQQSFIVKNACGDDSPAESSSSDSKILNHGNIKSVARSRMDSIEVHDLNSIVAQQIPENLESSSTASKNGRDRSKISEHDLENINFQVLHARRTKKNFTLESVCFSHENHHSSETETVV